MKEVMTATQILVGTPQRITLPSGRLLRTAIVKEPVDGPIALGPMGLEGDDQANKRFHGGADRALLFYPSSHYRAWNRDFSEFVLAVGAFGENLSVNGAEQDVCIGDIWQLGTATIQVCQPRKPCRTPGKVAGLARLKERMTESGRTGWLCRVLTPGTVEAPCELRLVAREWPRWTVARVNDVYRVAEPSEVHKLLQCSPLAEGFKTALITLERRKRA